MEELCPCQSSLQAGGKHTHTNTQEAGICVSSAADHRSADSGVTAGQAGCRTLSALAPGAPRSFDPEETPEETV